MGTAVMVADGEEEEAEENGEEKMAEEGTATVFEGMLLCTTSAAVVPVSSREKTEEG